MSPRSLLLALLLLCVTRPAAAESPPLPYWHVSLGPSVVGFEMRDGDAVDSARHSDLGFGLGLTVQLMGRIVDHVAVHGLAFYDLGAGSHEDEVALARHSGLGVGVSFLGAGDSVVVSASGWIGNAAIGDDETYGNFHLIGYELRATYRRPHARLGSGLSLAYRDAIQIEDHGLMGTRSVSLGYSISFR